MMNRAGVNDRGVVSVTRMNEFLRRRGGLSQQQIEALSDRDRVEMTQLLARSRYFANTQRQLMFEVDSPEHLPFTRASRIRAIALIILAVVVIIGCGLFGRIIL
jgi:hypothetical protein